MRLFIFISSALLSLTLVANDNAPSPQFVVHLLDYLASDYGGAVQNHHIVSKEEYAEQKEFAHTVVEQTESIPTLRNTPSILALVKNLQFEIENKNDAKIIAQLARNSQQLIISTAKLGTGPKKPPSFTNGKVLYQKHCLECHGINGLGDGINGTQLSPPPANFHKSERMNEITTYHAFNTIRFGVPNTGMTSWPEFSDTDAWDLATYVMGIRYEKLPKNKIIHYDLNELTTKNDNTILKELKGDDNEKKKTLAFLRTDFNNDNNRPNEKSTNTARILLKEAKELYDQNHFNEAEKKAISAYLEGIEPIEPELKLNAPSLLPKIETEMANLRKAIKNANARLEVESRSHQIEMIIDEIDQSLNKKELTFSVAFGGAFAIILREGFEAVLVIITLLSVLKTFNNRRARYYIHAGWILALGVGVLTWLLSGYLIKVSGLGQEMMEGVTGLFAVMILLYFGLWLHQQTEIGKWKTFIETKVQGAIEHKNLIALGSISFMAAYREAFETVLFIRTIWTQSGSEGKNGIFIGLLMAFIVIFGLSIWAIQYSAKIPLKNLFKLSSHLMSLLSIVLIGKAVHAFQSVGIIGINFLPVTFNFDLIGIYSTTQTLFAQFIVIGIITFFLNQKAKSV